MNIIINTYRIWAGSYNFGGGKMKRTIYYLAIIIGWFIGCLLANDIKNTPTFLFTVALIYCLDRWVWKAVRNFDEWKPPIIITDCNLPDCESKENEFKRTKKNIIYKLNKPNRNSNSE